MIQNRHRRAFVLIAAIAIGIALVFLMVPHTHSGDSGAWLAILPIMLFGVISPLSLWARIAFLYVAPATDAPSLPARFQRPPPLRLA